MEVSTAEVVDTAGKSLPLGRHGDMLKHLDSCPGLGLGAHPTP